MKALDNSIPSTPLSHSLTLKVPSTEEILNSPPLGKSASHFKYMYVLLSGWCTMSVGCARGGEKGKARGRNRQQTHRISSQTIPLKSDTTRSCLRSSRVSGAGHHTSYTISHPQLAIDPSS